MRAGAGGKAAWDGRVGHCCSATRAVDELYERERHDWFEMLGVTRACARANSAQNLLRKSKVPKHQFNSDVMDRPSTCVALQRSDQTLLDDNLPRVIGFVKFDADGTGKLSREQFHLYMQRETGHKLTEARAAELFDNADKNEDGEISYEELTALTASLNATVQSNGEANTVDAWTPSLEALLADVPFEGMVASLRAHLEAGGTAEVKKTEGSVMIKLLHSGGGWSMQSGSWS